MLFDGVNDKYLKQATFCQFWTKDFCIFPLENLKLFSNLNQGENYRNFILDLAVNID